MSGNNQVNKVIGREYLFRQFVAYNNLNKQYLRILDRKIARLVLRLDKVQEVLHDNNIDVDFTDIDELTDSEIDAMFEGEAISPAITISGNSTVEVGDTITLTSSESGVTWESSNVNVATVTQAGVVEGLDEGTVVITASKAGFIDGTITITITPEPESAGGGSNIGEE